MRRATGGALRRALGVSLALLGVASSAGAGGVAGRVQLEIEGVRLSDLGPTVVFLEPADGRPTPPRGDREPVVVRQRNARFDPPFLVVPVGQRVEMPNDDTIFHNVFSFSKPNDFDLGVYASGESRSVTLRHPGLVKLYCSIHESMSGAIVVTPTDWTAVVDADGSYAIRDVPPGDYRLTVWNERLPTGAHPVQVGEGSSRVDVEIGATPPAPAAPSR